MYRTFSMRGTRFVRQPEPVGGELPIGLDLSQQRDLEAPNTQTGGRSARTSCVRVQGSSVSAYHKKTDRISKLVAVVNGAVAYVVSPRHGGRRRTRSSLELGL